MGPKKAPLRPSHGNIGEFVATVAIMKAAWHRKISSSTAIDPAGGSRESACTIHIGTANIALLRHRRFGAKQSRLPSPVRSIPGAVFHGSRRITLAPVAPFHPEDCASLPFVFGIAMTVRIRLGPDPQTNLDWPVPKPPSFDVRINEEQMGEAAFRPCSNMRPSFINSSSFTNMLHQRERAPSCGVVCSRTQSLVFPFTHNSEFLTQSEK